MERRFKEIVNSLPEIDSIAIVDEEGFIVYRYDKPNLDVDPEEISVHLVNPVNKILEMTEDIYQGENSLEEIVLFTEKHVILVYKLVNDTFLVVLAKRTPLYGKVRFKIRSKLNEIKAAL
ncbi:MAG: roadblock/LC7 domain-containing protein [Desulfurobacteriaceae bacterium]